MVIVRSLVRQSWKVKYPGRYRRFENERNLQRFGNRAVRFPPLWRVNQSGTETAWKAARVSNGICFERNALRQFRVGVHGNYGSPRPKSRVRFLTGPPQFSEESSNGRTPDSEAAYVGSTPTFPTILFTGGLLVSQSRFEREPRRSDSYSVIHSKEVPPSLLRWMPAQRPNGPIRIAMKPMDESP